jgi:hypothetical protein
MKEPILDDELGRVYARALVAIARADGELVLDEILRLRALVARRLGHDIDDAALFAADGDVALDELLVAVRRQHGDPFRTAGLAPRALGRLLLTDGLSLALADGHICAEEVTMVEAMARALGCTDDDLAELRAHLKPWIELD